MTKKKLIKKKPIIIVKSTPKKTEPVYTVENPDIGIMIRAACTGAVTTACPACAQYRKKIGCADRVW